MVHVVRAIRWVMVDGQVRTSEITTTIRSLSFNLPSEVRCEVRGCSGKIREQLELGASSSGGWRKMSKVEEISIRDFCRYGEVKLQLTF